MIKIENYEVLGWEHAIRGMRNPKNSWDRSDSFVCDEYPSKTCAEVEAECAKCFYGGDDCPITDLEPHFVLGKNDHKLMMQLASAGPVHGKFRRMITVYVDITSPLYWWKEFDTYKVGTVANSCSTMHKIHSKPVELSDFSIDDFQFDDDYNEISLEDMFINIVADCEQLRQKFIETGDKKYWKGLIQLLPNGYNQKRTVQLNYEVLANMYEYRKAHKLDEWREFCQWIESLPYSEIITCGVKSDG